MPAQLRRVTLLALTCLAWAAACGPRERPSLSEWRRDWTSAKAAIPDAASFDRAADPSELCHATLVRVRELHASLLPSPIEELDPTVRRWLDRAEALGAECPALRGAAPLAEALAALRVLEAEIDAGLGASPPPAAD